MTLDNPRTRSGFTCPFCYGPKDQGLLACWYCFNRSGLRNGAPEAEAKLLQFEDFLASQERRA
jgi:hypothetical protein